MGIKDQSPVLRRAATVRRVDALFEAMSHDYLLRQQFITNPVGVLSEYVSGSQIPAERTAASNQLIYSVLSDSNLLSWLHIYATDHRGHIPTGIEFLNDFARAITDHGEHYTVIALIRSSVEGSSLIGFDADLLHFFFNLGVLVAGTDTEDGADAVNVDTPPRRKVDQDSGTLTAVTWETWLITRPSVDVDERFSARQPSEFGPRHVMVTLNELAAYAAALRRNGALDLSSSGP